MDKQLGLLAKRHMETKFCRINAEKSEYLVRKLNIWMMPSLVLCKDREVCHIMAGLNELGGTDQFTSQFLAYVLSQYEMVQYDGPVPESPTQTC